ncbi:MAG: hypothetical protein ACFFD4_07740 [Candidatus Odinarchaeota archaeon]
MANRFGMNEVIIYLVRDREYGDIDSLHAFRERAELRCAALREEYEERARYIRIYDWRIEEWELQE